MYLNEPLQRLLWTSTSYVEPSSWVWSQLPANTTRNDKFRYETFLDFRTQKHCPQMLRHVVYGPQNKKRPSCQKKRETTSEPWTASGPEKSASPAMEASSFSERFRIWHLEVDQLIHQHLMWEHGDLGPRIFSLSHQGMTDFTVILPKQCW